MAKRNPKSPRPSHSKAPIGGSVVVTPLPSSFSMGFPQVSLRREISVLFLNKEEDPSNNEKATFLQYYAGDACSSHGTFEDRLRTLPSEKDHIQGMDVVPIPLLQDDDLSVLTPPPPEVEKPILLKPRYILPGMDVVPIPLLQDDDLSILDPPPPEEEETIHVEPNDVLCGRGGAINRHWGNQTFRVEKAIAQWRYLQAATRREKQEIAKDLFDRMKHVHGSRFLYYCKTEAKWRVQSDEKALEKVKQALREHLTEEERKEKRDKHKRNKQLAQMQHSDCSNS